MNAKDLRIGNYTEYNIIDENIDEWVFNEVEVEDFFDLDNLRPIPLTEQWLIDFGFDKDIDKSYVKDGIAIFIDKRFKENVYFETSDTVTLSSSSWHKLDDVKIEFVHQFQNLFYSLKGKELKR